jgi:hypothetical protein
MLQKLTKMLLESKIFLELDITQLQELLTKSYTDSILYA